MPRRDSSGKLEDTPFAIDTGPNGTGAPGAGDPAGGGRSRGDAPIGMEGCTRWYGSSIPGESEGGGGSRAGIPADSSVRVMHWSWRGA
jgi:hypothetical protein